MTRKRFICRKTKQPTKQPSFEKVCIFYNNSLASFLNLVSVQTSSLI